MYHSFVSKINVNSCRRNVLDAVKQGQRHAIGLRFQTMALLPKTKEKKMPELLFEITLYFELSFLPVLTVRLVCLQVSLSV